jgi:ABC-type multidrug transport system fused ATPase/permease subunit
MAAELFDLQMGKAESRFSQLVQPSFYGYGAREVSKRPVSSTAFLAFSCLQSFGHAGLALAGAACAQAMLGGSPRIPAFVAFDSRSLVIRLATLGFVSACVKAVGGAGASYFQARLSGAFGDALRLDVLRNRALSVAHPRHDDQGSPEGASATFAAVDDLTTGVREAQAGFAATLGAFKASLQLAPLAALAAWSGTRMAGLALLVLVPFALLLGRAKKRVKSAQARALDGSAALLEVSDEAIRHAELWWSYGALRHVAERVRRAGEALTRRASRAAAVSAAISGATEALGALALLLALIGARSGVLGTSSDDGGRLLMFAVAFFMAYKPVRELAEARLAWTRAGAAMERLTKSESESESETETESETATATGTVELRGVKLARGKLGAIDARIETGEIVCICGATGIGKTTLLRTLLGLLRAKAGEVRVTGKPFAWVPQDAPIVRGTLAENVALGARGDVDVKGAMDAIGAGALFDRLGDAQLGVGGRALSGGEQKQVAIARALATNKPILLLDEPTNGLDDRAQALVLAAIERLRGKRTIVIVTHRTEPRAIADRVISFEATEARAADLAAP